MTFEKSYNPDQPRDDRGRWGEGSSGRDPSEITSSGTQIGSRQDADNFSAGSKIKEDVYHGTQSFDELMTTGFEAPGPDEVQNAKFIIMKVNEEHGLVFGWAMICKVDGRDYYDLNIDRDTMERVPEHIPEEVMMKSSISFMEGDRPGNVMHSGPDLGQFVFAFPLTSEISKALGIETRKTGLLVAFKPPKNVLAKFKDGTYKGFSIEGESWDNEEQVHG